MSKVHILKRICDLKYYKGNDIEEHLMKFKDLFEKLSNVGTYKVGWRFASDPGVQKLAKFFWRS